MAVDRSEMVKLLKQAFVDTVADVHPDPAPAGPMYVAFSQVGGTLEMFQRFMDILVEAGRLDKKGHAYVLSFGERQRRGLT